MTIFHKRRLIQEGDLCLFYISRDSVRPVRVQAGKSFQSRFGQVQHASVIGRPFGAQIPSTNRRGFVHVLRPTPELWTLSLPHRTQVVYTPDAAVIASMLRLRPGSRLIEAGTGSGSFSHAALRSILPHGHLYTYEFHETRASVAQAEFEEHGFQPDTLTLTHRDVCVDGFGLEEEEEENVQATAVFLDLPAPWLAIPKLAPLLKPDYAVRMCCFSPCMEQVQRTVEEMRQSGWTDVVMVEIQHRANEARRQQVRGVEDAFARIRLVRHKRAHGLHLARDGEDPPPKEDRAGRGVREGDPNFEWLQVSREEDKAKTHTSYLTFATRSPVS